MKDETILKQPAAPEPSKPDLYAMLESIQQQLLLLEKKVDQLVGRSQEKNRSPRDRSFRKDSFSKPFKSFDPSRHRGKGERDRGSRENATPGHFYEYYDRRPKEKGRTSSLRKKVFGFKRKDEE
jgi:hypothetical protein